MNEITDSLRERKSVRLFERREVPEEVKRLLFECALAAPSAGNMVLYRIIDVTDPDIKAGLAVSCDNQSFIAAAPVVLVFVVDIRRWQRCFEAAGAGPRPLAAGDLMLSVADACIAAQNVVVAAQSLGLGSCYIGDVLEQYETHRELLGLPEGCMPACMLVLGYPTPQQRQRKKPQRFDTGHIVNQNRYVDYDEEELVRAYRERASREGGSQSFEDNMTAFCARKHNSDFSREMSRSVSRWISDYSGEQK